MKNQTIFFLFFISCVAGCGSPAQFAGSPGQTLGESCLSLSASIERSPGEHPGEVDYQEYAHLKTPPLPPDEAVKRFQLEEGFRIELVACEPMVVDPIAMDIDADGRLWVVNMPSYNRMPVRELLETTGERTTEREAALEEKARQEKPDASIVILEDTDTDGVMDKYRVFKEGLDRPLAIKVLSDGVLVGAPPNLWLIRDTDGNGKGDEEELVSDSYGPPPTVATQGGNNNLLWGSDNWIYSTDFPSLRRVSGRWQTRPFEPLGQWGLAQDNWGRLYSSHNSWPLQAHLIPHGYSERHPGHKPEAGVNLRIAPNEPLWPAHPTGVNRGYRVGVITREDGTLRQATGVAATVIYRGHQFGEQYQGNAFSPEAAGNLIKRLIIAGDPGDIDQEARFAYEGREFLTSTDERFRPVNIYNAPDGAIYVVDMYRGLYDYLLWVTDYLRDYTLEHELDIPTGIYGRIYRIVRDDREIDYRTPKFSKMTPTEASEYLRHSNGWLRDTAQQVLVQCPSEEVIPILEEMVNSHSEQPWTRFHALWTLEGLPRATYRQDRLTQVALRALDDPHPRLRSSAIRILEPAISAGLQEVLGRLERLIADENAPYVLLQLLASLGESHSDRALQMMASILDQQADSIYFRDIALTGDYQREARLEAILREEYNWDEELGEGYAALLTSLSDGAPTASDRTLDHLSSEEKTLFEQGAGKWAICMACHGAEGQGIAGVGPALNGSEWVTGNPQALARIVLQGFRGGAAERGEAIPNEMPGHAFMSDQELAGILTYIRHSWGNQASPVTSDDIGRVRHATAGRTEPWTPAELRRLDR